MNITSDSTSKQRFVRVSAADSNAAVFSLAVEHTLDICINGEYCKHLCCTPEYLEELSIGYLLSEGFIEQIEDIQNITLCDDSQQAIISLQRNLYGITKNQEEMTRSFSLDFSMIDFISEHIQDTSALYALTHATHACYLYCDNKLLCCREDISRHNAIDKVVGWGLINKIDLTQCIIFTTGRMPNDVVGKIANCKIPVLVSKTFPTDQGLNLAKQKGITLVTIKKDGAVVVWNN